MALCSACQRLLSRIILYQLGRVANVPNVYGDAFGDGQHWKGTSHCLICRVFTTHLSTRTKLEIRRCKQSRLNAKDESTSVQVTLGDGPQAKVGLTVDLLNAADLLENWEQRFGSGELSIHGPLLTHPNLIDHVEKYESISKASGWLRACNSDHDRCKITASSRKSMPARVLDIRRNNDCNDIRLISGSGIEEDYAALSYCWGNESLLTTTKAKLSEHTRSIPLTLLSPLIQDAIHIARELRLGYLWIDALCILQDDMDEWQSVASEMGTIFRNAYVTLAATGAENSSQRMYPKTVKAKLKFQTAGMTGCNEAHGIDATETSSTWVFSLHKKASPVKDILRAPLNKRAWVLQELMLSQRTLHFAKDQIFWHCKELATSADGVFSNAKGVMSDLGWYYGPDVSFESVKPRRPKEVIRDFQVRRWRRPDIIDDDEEVCIEKIWWRIVEDYSARKLTHLSDKLIALSGIVNLVQKMRNDMYVVGMWEQDLPEALLWYNDGSESEAGTVSGIPSWSWTSIDCPVRMPRSYRSGSFSPLVKVVDFGVDRSGTSVAHQATSGILRLGGDLINLAFEYTGSEKSIFIRLFRVTTKEGKSSRTDEGSATLDTENHDIENLDQIWGLPIGVRYGEIHVLILRKVDTHVDTFQRLGTGSLSTVHMDMEYFETKHAAKRTINLI
ncbi:Hypothetical protein R9X50_00551600 [Acrodontium crateriforme]|uniref:Heterokaryon incompatibility domain-containing protein n=1 Tax=Acrodontium crateriforme TaxID=150365 RepID=A0AAQ3M9S3_9PEZI|nr:Hypothetical protein R9X50_00551600 [Acrodontium crateriforme]